MTALLSIRQRPAAAVLVAATGVILAGCSQPTVPPAERPEVVWTDGEPAGPLEDDPWVQAVRASDLELSIARVTLDLTEPGLVETNTSSQISWLFGSIEATAESEGMAYPPGPTPMIPVHVEESGDGESATVLMCAPVAWTVTADETEPENPLRGRFDWYDLVMEDGRRKLDSIGAGNIEGSEHAVGKQALEPFLDDREDSDCTLDDAKVGLFDPAPDVSVEYTPEDIKTTTED